jgi:hypothetical protein
VLRNASLAPAELLKHLRQGSWPELPYAPMRPDRYRPGLFPRTDVQALREGRIQPIRTKNQGKHVFIRIQAGDSLIRPTRGRFS